MNNSISELIATMRTFRFASGQLVTLDSDQIERIPYLAAIVSSADHFESICDERGYLKLDPHIEFKHFSYAVESLSFHSVRQIFTHLPKEDDIIPIIALFDFLGIGPRQDPTLNEVDSAFFSHVVHSPVSGRHLQIYTPSSLQDMAVQFGTAMIKEEYDFTNPEVVDEIYWYIMFILSAYTLFGPRLRHHMYKIAQYCFSLFSPCRLRSLNKLLCTTVQNRKKKILATNDEDADPDQEITCLLQERLYPPSFHWFSFLRHPTISSRRSLLNRTSLDASYRSEYPINEEKLFEPIHQRIVETIYERLQSEICRQAKAEMHKCQSKCIQKRNYEWILNSIFEHDLVQEEICKLILDEIPKLKHKLEDMRTELVEKAQNYDHSRETLFGYFFFITNPFEVRPSRLNFENIQKRALFYELLLDKIRQCPFIVVEQIRQGLVKMLYEVALKQIIEWENTEVEIITLRKALLLWRSPKEIFKSISTPIYQKYWPSEKRPLKKIQPKYSTR